VLLTCVLGDEWTAVNEQTDYPALMARNLLIEFIGGELRDQFA